MFNQEFTQEIFIAVVISALTGLIVLIREYFRESLFARLPYRKERDLIELLEKVSYPVENSKNKYINALIFKRATGRYAPIHIVNQVFKCYDPYSAARIYARVPSYLELNSVSEKGPSLGWRKFSKIFAQILWVISFLVFVRSTYLAVSISSELGSIALQANRLEIYTFLIGSFLFLYTVSITIFYWANNELIFLRSVDQFYEQYWATYRLFSSD